MFCLNGCIFSVIPKCYGGAIYRCGIEIKLYDEKVVFKKKGRKQKNWQSVIFELYKFYDALDHIFFAVKYCYVIYFVNFYMEDNLSMSSKYHNENGM